MWWDGFKPLRQPCEAVPMTAARVDSIRRRCLIGAEEEKERHCSACGTGLELEVAAQWAMAVGCRACSASA